MAQTSGEDPGLGELKENYFGELEGRIMATIVPSCPYLDVCSDNGVKCKDCAHDPKRSYYKPRDTFYEPYYPYYPWYPYCPNYPWYYDPYLVTCDTTENKV